jgi:hypothetical protein
MSEVSPNYLKELWRALVDEFGGVEAAGSYLGISHQRVSQVGKPDDDKNMPALLHIARLEQKLGLAIVTGALAKLATDGDASADLDRESREAVYAAVDLQEAIDDGAQPRTIRKQLCRLLREAQDVEVALQRVDAAFAATAAIEAAREARV